jgi:hypothetical protein
MQTVELFSGTKSFSKVAAGFGHPIFTVDNDPSVDPDLVADIRLLSSRKLPSSPFILWASPPCQTFSVAALHHHWKRDGTPRTLHGHRLVAKTVSLIIDLHPRWWFIENPRGMLRTVAWFGHAVRHLGGRRQTVTYCSYDADVFKPTDIWSNAHWWHARPRCRLHNPCPRLRAGQSHLRVKEIRLGMDTRPKERSRIPPGLFVDIFTSLKGSSP